MIPSLATAKAALTSTGFLIKAGILVGLLALSFGQGWKCSADHSQGKVDKEIERTAEANGRATHNFLQGQALADQLEAITVRTRADKAAADTRVATARAEAAAAAAETETARQHATKVEADLEKAKRVPECRKLLETRSCAAFK